MSFAAAEAALQLAQPDRLDIVDISDLIFSLLNYSRGTFGSPCGACSEPNWMPTQPEPGWLVHAFLADRGGRRAPNATQGHLPFSPRRARGAEPEAAAAARSGRRQAPRLRLPGRRGSRLYFVSDRDAMQRLYSWLLCRRADTYIHIVRQILNPSHKQSRKRHSELRNYIVLIVIN